MSKNLFTIGLVLTSFILQGCNSAISQSANTNSNNVASLATITPSPKAQLPEQQKVEFKGVSFTYNPQIFGEVKSEDIAEHLLEYETDKPGGEEPQHRLFSFGSSTNNRHMYIAVYPINEFPRMYAVNKSLVKIMEKEIINLQKVVRDKNFRVNGQIPYLPFIDASQTFQKKVKHFSFQNGRGIFFLTQIDIEPTLINNEGLTYYFQGISDDEEHYILAEFRVNVSFLPKDYEAREFEDYKLSSAYSLSADESSKHEKYLSEITSRLEGLKPNEFTPSLDEIEKIIASLKIEK